MKQKPKIKNDVKIKYILFSKSLKNIANNWILKFSPNNKNREPYLKKNIVNSIPVEVFLLKDCPNLNFEAFHQ